MQHKECMGLRKCAIPVGVTPRKNPCKYGHFQSNFRIASVAMATLILDIASWVGTSKGAQDNLLFGTKH